MSAKREEKRNKERFAKVKNLPDNKKCFLIGQRTLLAHWPSLVLVGNDQLLGQTPQTPFADGGGPRSPRGWPLLRVGAASEHLREPVKLAHDRGAEPSGSALGVCDGDAFQG